MTTPAGGRAALTAWIAADPALTALLAEARAAAARDAAHDDGHVLRVALWTRVLLRAERGSELPAEQVRLAVAAALLHDAVNLPKDHPDRARASERCAEHARERLAALGFAPDEVAVAADAIRDHSFSRGATPATALGRALQDADRLEALGAIGVMRTFSTGARMGAGYFHGDDPWALARDLDDRAWSVDHFFRKLLALPATMQTAAGRAEAGRRVALLRTFLQALGDEIGEPPPADRLASGAASERARPASAAAPDTPAA